MSSMEIPKALVARVARAFYDPRYIVILDELNNSTPNNTGVREDEMVQALKMTAREIHKICGKLKEDRLLKMTTRMEARKQDQRPVPKTYYYLDYKEFVDVVKWKMYKMQTSVRDNLRTESENKGYICPNCNRQYLPLEAVSLLDPSDGLFHCDACTSVLEENDNAESVQGSQKELTRLREQSQPIISLLKQTDSLTIPANYIFKPTGTAARNNGSRDDHELAIARDTGAGQGEIIVDLQMDNEAARRAKLEEAEEKRQQNALPVWHQRSTVQDSLAGTGDRPKDTEKKEEKESFDEVATEEFDADRHDYYAKYYESLSAAAPGGGMDGMDGMDEDEDEEFEAIADGADYYSPDVNGGQRSEEEMMEEFGGDEDIPLVSVNGKMVPLNEVMEEDQRNMTTEEYKAYYEAWQTWQAS